MRDASANEEDPQILLLHKLLEVKRSLSAEDRVDFFVDESGVASTVPPPAATVKKTPKRKSA